jgi:site-specific DNA-methyltransferase (adenine-specific)
MVLDTDAQQGVADPPPAETIAIGENSHRLYLGDARSLDMIADRSVHLIVTSPPYGSLKEYPDRDGQLGNMESYEEFLDELDNVWSECFRVLVPGGRVCAVVGDVCLSRRKAGRHYVLPLASDIQVRARRLGLDVLTPVIWLKVANITLEASRSSRFLGKPYLPGGVIKNDRETIVMLRKPGGYRKPTPEMEDASRIAKDDYFRWFSPIWSNVTGASTRDHPAPYPPEIPRRLIAMYSFVGDTVVDPFSGTGTTALAAAELGRNSISVEIDPDYVRKSIARLLLAKGKVTKLLEVRGDYRTSQNRNGNGHYGSA